MERNEKNLWYLGQPSKELIQTYFGYIKGSIPDCNKKMNIASSGQDGRVGKHLLP